MTGILQPGTGQVLWKEEEGIKKLKKKIEKEIEKELERQQGGMDRKEFEAMKNRVQTADCMDILKRLPSESIDLVIADPPYFRMKGEFDFTFRTEEEYLAWCKKWVAECHRVLKPDGAFYCWGSSLMIDRLSVCVLDKFDWIKRNLIVWNYHTGRPGKAAFRNEAEFLWFYAKPYHVIDKDAVRIPYFPGYEKDKRHNPKGKSCGNVWECSRILPNFREATGHPTQKPEKLAERMILASCRSGGLVFIPFAGSGSEMAACIRNGRNFIATEINPSYVEDIIVPRMWDILLGRDTPEKEEPAGNAPGDE